MLHLRSLERSIRFQNWAGLSEWCTANSRCGAILFIYDIAQSLTVHQFHNKVAIATF
jgi:hypothetical protein